MVLRPHLRGNLFFYLIQEFFLWNTSLSVLELVLSYLCRLCACLCSCIEVCDCVFECSWLTGQGLWTLRPGWRFERPLEGPWKPLQPILTTSGGGGAEELGGRWWRSKPERGGQEVDVKSKRSGEHLQSNEVSVFSAEFLKGSAQWEKKMIKCEKTVLRWNTGYSGKEQVETLPWGEMPGPMAPSSCDGASSKCFLMPIEFINSGL